MEKKYFKVTFEAEDPVSKEVHTHTPVYRANTSDDAIESCKTQIELYKFFKDSYSILDSVEVK